MKKVENHLCVDCRNTVLSGIMLSGLMIRLILTPTPTPMVVYLYLQ